MQRSEATEYLKLMDSVFKGGSLAENRLAREEYIKVLVKIDLDLMTDVFDSLAKITKFFPSISEIHEVHENVKRIKRDNQKTIQPDTTCYVCENKGFVMYKDHYNYEYLLYCTECEKGEEFKYQGKDCKKKSEYCTEPVTQYFDVEELMGKNMFKSHNIVSCPSELKRSLMRIGVRV